MKNKLDLLGRHRLALNGTAHNQIANSIYDYDCSSFANAHASARLGGGGAEPRIAFTLAEVLITLGIIGVVAAITMPSLISKYQQKTFETAFKKQYSVLSNTVEYLTLNESLVECYFRYFTCPTESNPNNLCYGSVYTDCQVLKEGMISKLKLTPLKNHFVYKTKAQVLAGGGVTPNDSVAYDNLIKNQLKPYLLPDGAVLFFSDSDNVTEMAHNQFVIDINGEKGPNRWGYDVFWLNLIKKNDKVRLTDEYSGLSEKGGSLPKNILQNKWSNEIDKNLNLW